MVRIDGCEDCAGEEKRCEMGDVRWEMGDDRRKQDGCF